MCFFVNKGKMTNFCWHDKQKVNGLRKVAWASVWRLHVSIFPCLHVFLFLCLCLHVSSLHVSMSPGPCFLNSNNKKWNQRKMATSVCLLQTGPANFRLFAANGNRKRKFIFLSLWTINGGFGGPFFNIYTDTYTVHLQTAFSFWNAS